MKEKILIIFALLVCELCSAHGMIPQRVYKSKPGVVNNTFVLMNNSNMETSFVFKVFFVHDINEMIDPLTSEDMDFQISGSDKRILNPKQSVSVKIRFLANQVGIYKVCTIMEYSDKVTTPTYICARVGVGMQPE